MNYWNFAFDKGRLKNFVLWFFSKYGEHKTVCLLDSLKSNGFSYATKAGISLGIDDLKIPPRKALLIAEAEKQTKSTINQYKRGEITGVERFQQIISTWHETSENIKQEVIEHFKRTDILNPVFMMAFSGARGNVSQVRQLVGMRGLMADPQGKILDFPIRSNFKEGLTLTEYIISCYGARKGIVDTALRTANAGYLTRRLVDVAQHVVVSQFDCGTKRGIVLTKIKEGNSVILTLRQRIVGRVLAQDVFQIATQISDWVGQRTKGVLSPAASFAEANNRGEGVADRLLKQPLARIYVKSLTLLLSCNHPLKNGRGRPLSAPLGLRIGCFCSASYFRANRVAVLCSLLETQQEITYPSLFSPSALLIPKRGRDLLLSQRNQEITMELAAKLAKNQPKIFVRSSLTCESLNNMVASIRDLSTTVAGHKPCLISPKGLFAEATAGARLSKYLDTKGAANTIPTGIPSPFICQLCYGWSLAQGNLVSIGEAVGIIAAQAIGEPGTQLTMRTFHTGGVFSGDVNKQIRAPFNGYAKFPKTLPGTLIRTSEGRIAFLTKTNGHIIVKPHMSLPIQDLPRSPIGLGALALRCDTYFACSPQCSSAADYVGCFSNPESHLQGISSADTCRNAALGGRQQAFGHCPDKERQNFNPSGKGEGPSCKGKGKNITQRGFAIPAFTLLFVRNGETVFFKQVIAQTSNFSKNQFKKKDVERIINAEIDGQLVFSNIKMKDLLLVLKKAELITDSVPCSESRGAARSPFIAATESGRLHAAAAEREMKHTIATQRLEDWDAMDFENEIRESLKKGQEGLNQINHWTFGYILSAKIYQLAIAASFFPTQGDYIGLSFGVWPLTGLLQVERTTIVKTPEISDREFRAASARGGHGPKPLHADPSGGGYNVIWETTCSNKKLQQGDSQRESHSFNQRSESYGAKIRIADATLPPRTRGKSSYFRPREHISFRRLRSNTWLLSKRNAPFGRALINKKSFLTQIKLRLKKSVTNFPPCASEKGLLQQVNNISLLRIQNVQFNKFLGNLFLSFNKSICIQKKIEQMPCLFSILHSYYRRLPLPRAIWARWKVWAVLATWGVSIVVNRGPKRSNFVLKQTTSATLMSQPGHAQVVELFDPTGYISIWYKNKNCRFDAKISRGSHVTGSNLDYVAASRREHARRSLLLKLLRVFSCCSPASALKGWALILAPPKGRENFNQRSEAAFLKDYVGHARRAYKGRGLESQGYSLFISSPSKVKISEETCSLRGLRAPFILRIPAYPSGGFDAGGDRILFQEGALANTKMFFGQKNVHLNLFSKLNMNKIAFSSPFQGEILNISKKKCLVLTKWDKISFYNFMGPLILFEHPIGDLGCSLLCPKEIAEATTGTLAISHSPSSQSKIKLGDNSLPFPSGYMAEKPIRFGPFGHCISQSPAAQRALVQFKQSKTLSPLTLGHFLVYGNLLLDKNFDKAALKTSGQIISLNKMKITLRRSQPVFLSPNAILHAQNGAFVTKNTPLMTLPFQVLTTGDIVQGIPKIEQFFEARTTKNGRFFRESIPNLLILLFQRYKTRFPLNQAVRQSFYKIQQIIIDGVQRVYRSQGVTLADKHIEIIVKQMTKKVVLTKSGQSGFLVGELLDLEFVEKINQELIQKMHYEPIILGITKASLRVESFLSAASFQQTTKVLSRAAIAKKRDFLLGLKESVILGNLIPTGTGYLKEHQRS
jgi:hypothetical protein